MGVRDVKAPHSLHCMCPIMRHVINTLRLKRVGTWIPWPSKVGLNFFPFFNPFLLTVFLSYYRVMFEGYTCASYELEVLLYFP